MQLKDKVSIITGGASGFGAAGALRFAQVGSAVVVADLNEELEWVGASRPAERRRLD
ncbi:hypothetical protein ABZS88_40035 [Streptomyces sp. NPDC005480]|uniref:hypothetical protein n=1 Tax=Streptomyces sp. NPDC005480 TaxID=3154880 RepID=UPI0033BCE92D